MNTKKQKVAVIRLSSLGDVVLSSAVLDPLHAAGYEVSFITKKAFAPLLEQHPAVTEIYAYEKGSSEAAAREQFFSWFEARDFAFVIDLHDSWRTWFWRWRLKKRAPVYVAQKERLREWLIFFARLGRFVGFRRGGRALKFRRIALDALSAKGILVPNSASLTRLFLGAQEEQKMAALLPPGDFAVLLPGSAWKGKEWPHFAELGKLLARKVPVVVLGGEKDFVCDEIALASGGLSLRGRTTLRESMAVIAKARWVIGNDTGMVHVAEALGKDVAMIEGPTHEYMGFSPYRERSVLLGLPLLCRPCSKTGKFCPRFGTRKCLWDLSVSRVAEVLRSRAYPC